MSADLARDINKYEIIFLGLIYVMNDLLFPPYVVPIREVASSFWNQQELQMLFSSKKQVLHSQNKPKVGTFHLSLPTFHICSICYKLIKLIIAKARKQIMTCLFQYI